MTLKKKNALLTVVPNSEHKIVEQSQWEGFSKLKYHDRIRKVAQIASLSATDVELFESILPKINADLAETCIENAIGYMAIPLGVAAYFLIDGVDVPIPMAVEETSIIAAASSAAKFLYPHGGVTTKTLGRLSIGQIHIPNPKKPDAFIEKIESLKNSLIGMGNSFVPGLVRRGGGVKTIEIRRFEKMIVLHVLIDTCDAMGANLINQICEGLKPTIQKETNEKIGLCILSNLTDRRLSYAKVRISNVDKKFAQDVIHAYEFAMNDPYRASTHNKGIFNAIDAILLATGNDWRAMEAGAHAFTSLTGRYLPLSTWTYIGNDLIGEITLPTSVGIVGGVTRIHPTAQACLKMMGITSADHLGRICAAVGLVQNFAALRSLVTQGIVKGHMTLHIANLIAMTDANEDEKMELRTVLEKVLGAEKNVTSSHAIQALNDLRNRKALRANHKG